MRHYCTRQRESDKRWDFTVDLRDGGARPVGYCCAYKEFDPKVFAITEEEQAEYKATAHKHHTDGHATSEEACECYKQYQLDHELSLNRTMANQQLKCQVCGVWTDKFAELGASLFTLCSEHNNRESVASLYKAPTEMWVS